MNENAVYVYSDVEYRGAAGVDIVECPGNQQWSTCTGGRQCIATCAILSPLCNRNCYPGCQCPIDKPILHHGHCITAQQCEGTLNHCTFI